MPTETDKLTELEKRVDKHDWVISGITEQLIAVNNTLKKLDEHIISFNEFHTEYKFYAGEILKIQKQINDIPNFYVSKAEFSPTKKLVNGAVTIILTAVLGAIVYLVIK